MKSITQEIYIFRLHPGQDLKEQLITIAKNNNIHAGYIITCTGSLKEANLRLANSKESKKWLQKMEIVSLVGTVSIGGCHLHIALSDVLGNTIGGHLLDGCKIYTTAEVVIGNAIGLEFKREQDHTTGYLELDIKQKND